jgi:hypothetical protein
MYGKAAHGAVDCDPAAHNNSDCYQLTCLKRGGRSRGRSKPSHYFAVDITVMHSRP